MPFMRAPSCATGPLAGETNLQSSTALPNRTSITRGSVVAPLPVFAESRRARRPSSRSLREQRRPAANRSSRRCASVPRHRRSPRTRHCGASFVRLRQRRIPAAADLWVQASLDQRQRLQQLFFPDGISFDGNGFVRTAVTAPAFSYLRPIEAVNEGLVDLTGIEPVTS